MCGSVGIPHERVSKIDQFTAAFERAIQTPGPRMIEIDMVSIGPFSQSFAGPPAGAAVSPCDLTRLAILSERPESKPVGHALCCTAHDNQVQGVKRMNHSRRSILASLAIGAISCAWPAQAQDAPPAFPRKAMTFVVPLSAGGPVDILGRLLAQEYQTRTGQSATVENKTGGAGNIGIDMVRKSTPDGTTLLVIPAGNLTINPTLLKNFSFQVERDFAPITMLATAPNIVLASHQLGVSTVAELIAKAKQGKVTYGTPGVGSQLHLLMELLRVKTGGEFVHVPYRGSAPALNDLIGGHIDLVSTNLTAALGAIQAGTVVPLAMTTAQRSPLVPNVTTLMEAGIPDIDVTSWYGLLSPHAVPADVHEAIFTVTRDVLSTPVVQGKLQAQGLSAQIEEFGEIRSAYPARNRTMGGCHQEPQHHRGVSVSWMACQMRGGVAGSGMSSIPHSDNASKIALMTAGGPPTFPASLPPFTPSRFVFVGTRAYSEATSGMW